MKISVVIATFNRHESLRATLNALRKQTVPVDEIIIVDASDTTFTNSDDTIIYLRSSPSVCKQRNTGIRKASGDYILILDDDILLQENYIEVIRNFFLIHPEEGAASGWVMERNNKGEWQYEFPISGSFGILHSFIFQTGVWMDWNKYSKGFHGCLFRLLYPEKKNDLSHAGWPVLLNFEQPVFKTKVYGLGAAIIKKEWLIQSPFPEELSSNGVGENYGVALGFPVEDSICVLSGTKAYHYRSEQNRETKNNAYFQRVMALHYFMLTRPRFRWIHRVFLAWSVLGNLCLGIKNRQAGFIKVNLKLFFRILSGNNPYKKSPL